MTPTDQEIASFRARKLRLVEHIPSVTAQWGEYDSDGAQNPEHEMAGVFAGAARRALSLHDCCRFVAKALHRERFGARDDVEANKAWDEAQDAAWAEATAYEAIDA